MGDGTPTGILTKGQREYITGQKEPVQERTTKTRIRDRLAIAITLDIPLVNAAVKDEDIDAEAVVDSIGLSELTRVLEDQVELTYQLAQAGGLSPESVIENGLQKAQGRRADELLKQFNEDPTSMTFTELSLLHEAEKINESELLEAFRQNPQKSRSGLTSRGELNEIKEALKEAGYGDHFE